MITGSFDGEGRPYVQGRLIISRFKVDGFIDFLMDTGADTTTLHPDDGIQLNVPFNRLRNRTEVGGIGGTHEYFYEPVILIFADGQRLRLYSIWMSIAKPHAATNALPSLLGRDILNQWRMRYDFPSNRLEFAVKSADATVRAP
ncbi:MAG: hypothetical protein IIB15_05105 [Chloroflexi bacterium]|nr:hypothetical protein [Chloroflexota bacterium]